MIVLKRVSKIYQGRVALQPLDLELASGQTHVLIGSSGSGKSTILRLLCGLIDATTGTITVNGKIVSTNVQRELALQNGYVIQEGGLFPHLTAWDNIALATRIEHWPKQKTAARIKELAQLVQLDEHLLDQYPAKLSGGQRQRVALMRALVLDPQLLLLDEPLGALDPVVRADLQVELKRICNTVKKTVVLVTHDIGEAAFFGHTVSLFREGHLIQHGDFATLVKSPANEFVTRFINAQTPPKEMLEALR